MVSILTRRTNLFSIKRFSFNKFYNKFAIIKRFAGGDKIKPETAKKAVETISKAECFGGGKACLDAKTAVSVMKAQQKQYSTEFTRKEPEVGSYTKAHRDWMVQRNGGLTSGLQKNGIYIQRRFATFFDFFNFQKETNTTYKKVEMRRKGHPANNHLVRIDNETDEANALSHSKMCGDDRTKENPLVCYGDHDGQPAYTALKSYIQRVVRTPVKDLRLVNLNWRDVADLDIENLRTIDDMMKIMKKDPKGFEVFQMFVRDFHKDKSLDPLEKTTFLRSVCDSFISEYKIKEKE